MGCAFGASRSVFIDRLDYPDACSAAADINGDGIPDLICTTITTLDVVTMLGNGDGTFHAGPESDISFFGTALAADLNGDGIPDLILVGGPNLARCCVAVSLGNGDGTFQTATSYPAGSDKDMSSLILGDFNGDGILDVGTLAESGLWLFTGKGGGVLNPGVLTPIGQSGNNLYSVAATDIDGDDNLDVVASTQTGFAVLLGNGNGTFQPAINTASSFPDHSSTGLAVGDLSRGGGPDVILVDSSYTSVLVYPNKGGGHFAPPRPVYLPGNTNIAIGDVNGDGIPDLISPGVYIAFGQGDLRYTMPIYYATASPPIGGGVNPFIADLRRNGQLDIVVSNFFGGGSVLLNQGKGTFEDGNWTSLAGGGAGCSVVADFNGDGEPDLAIVTTQGISLLLGTGNASAPFRQGEITPVTNVWCLAEGDINNDGIPDLLILTPGVTYPKGTAITYLGKGDGTFTLAGSTPLSHLGTAVLGDFNGDGKTDFALDTNVLALGNGDGTFQTPHAFAPRPPPEGFTNIAARDLNGDGTLDIVLASLFNSQLFILLNNGAGVFTQTGIDTYGACYDAGFPTIADVNGDGSPDIVLGCQDGKTAIYLNNGAGAFTFAKSLTNAVQFAGSIPIVADVNGDGIPDIVVEESNSIVLYLGQGGLNFLSPFAYLGVGTTPAGVFAANVHGQAPGAGTPDLVVPDASGSVLTIINRTKHKEQTF
jgi:hypothetical protein